MWLYIIIFIIGLILGLIGGLAVCAAGRADLEYNNFILKKRLYEREKI